MHRTQIAALLREVAVLLELRGENPFRCRAFANGARAIEGMAEDPLDLFEAGTLGEVRGIGPGLVAGIAEIVLTGSLALLAELRAEFPAGVRDLLRIPGLGPKRLHVLLKDLQIDSPAALERACREGRVAALPGFGAKSQEKLLQGLGSLQRFGERHLQPAARGAAEELALHLRAHPAVADVVIAGSLRRGCETIGDLDLLVSVGASDRSAVVEHFLAAPSVLQPIEQGVTKAAVVVAGGLRADLRLVERDEMPAALLHFTGSKEHNVQLRSRAKGYGWTLNEYGLHEGETRFALDSESAIYGKLGLSFLPPETREGMGEIELAEAGAIPALVELADLRGTLHVHTDWSDGIATLETMALAAGNLGWEYLGIADHSRAAAYARGLDAARVRRQWEEIDRWNAAGRKPWLFKGTECDILADGALDFDDELLLGFDYVVASVHSRFNLSREAMTARWVRAASHPCVTFLGHPTGRLLLVREPYDVDLDRVLQAARENGAIPELNANPHRLDLDWRQLRLWLAGGGTTSIHPDAHSPHGLTDVQYGIGIARKALAVPGQVLNCRPVGELRDYFDARRERARGLLGRGGPGV
ncbi:MAG: DNA polymerase/3'-5' exonuclease PolX [Thermoanaerobaculia bacterium]|nr:DNA polymerase/3'-5' exonuclease PolX [Thermoanaerobaculia bacterium]MBP9822730.1 DNA polymerase/3'-5' exonuclease PolX [Thermoanaerobaculia bacterium]